MNEITGYVFIIILGMFEISLYHNAAENICAFQFCVEIYNHISAVQNSFSNPQEHACMWFSKLDSMALKKCL